MHKKRKKRTKKPDILIYEIEVDDWELDYHFGLQVGNRSIGDYWQHTNMILLGNIKSPVLKNITRARIYLSANPELDEHWKRPESEKPPLSIGMIQVLKDNVTLEFYCSVPLNSFVFLPATAAAGKIKYATISGEQLKWRKARIKYISLSTSLEEE